MTTSRRGQPLAAALHAFLRGASTGPLRSNPERSPDHDTDYDPEHDRQILEALRGAWARGIGVERMALTLALAVGAALEAAGRVGIEMDPRLPSALEVAVRWSRGRASRDELAGAYGDAFRAHLRSAVAPMSSGPTPMSMDGPVRARAGAAVFAVLAAAYDARDLVAMGSGSFPVPFSGPRYLPTYLKGLHEDAVAAEEGGATAAAASAALNLRDLRVEMFVASEIATRQVVNALRAAL